MRKRERERKRDGEERGKGDALYDEKRFYARGTPRLTFSAKEKPSWICVT